MDILLKNRSSGSFDLCKSSPNCTQLLPGDTLTLPLTAVGWMSGHCAEGSFIIRKNGNDISFKTWGAVSLEMHQNAEEAHIQITMEYWCQTKERKGNVPSAPLLFIFLLYFHLQYNIWFQSFYLVNIAVLQYALDNHVDICNLHDIQIAPFLLQQHS